LTKDTKTENIQKYFNGKETFSREELYAFYTKYKPDLKETTFRWIIFNLKKLQIITSVSRGLFTLSFKPLFKPEPDQSEKKLFSTIEKQFPSLKFCIWSTSIVSEFMLHLPVKNITILQAEKEALEPIYDFLKEKKFSTIFIQPIEKEIEKYIFESEKAIVLLPLVSKSPLQNINKVSTTTLEKLIVDLYADKKIFATYQGSELAHIVNNAYSRYAIDFTKLFHYAKRRRKDSDLRQFFIDKTDVPKNILND
jgi:hypothetical protein